MYSKEDYLASGWFFFHFLISAFLERKQLSRHFTVFWNNRRLIGGCLYSLVLARGLFLKRFPPLITTQYRDLNVHQCHWATLFAVFCSKEFHIEKKNVNGGGDNIDGHCALLTLYKGLHGACHWLGFATSPVFENIFTTNQFSFCHQLLGLLNVKSQWYLFRSFHWCLDNLFTG